MSSSTHRVLRYVLKVGDLEAAIHIFRDLLEMTIFNHEEFRDGSADGGDVHYEGRWSRTLVGYGEASVESTSIQLTFNHGVEKYERGNQLQSIQIQLASTRTLEEAGISKELIRGRRTFLVDCEGYKIEVTKSGDKKNRIGGVIFNCHESLVLTSPTILFWTECLMFVVIAWSSDLAAKEKIINSSVPMCCPCFFRRKRRSTFKSLQRGEQPYVELKYGSSSNFVVRLQMLPKGVELGVGTAMERLLLTSTREDILKLSDLVKTRGKVHGGTETKKSFQLVPGRTDLIGVVAHDPNGLEVCYYSDEEVRLITESQLDADEYFRTCMSEYKHRMEERKKRGRVPNHINSRISLTFVQEVPVADDIIKRIQSHKGVQGVIVTTKDGTPIRSTMDNTSTVLFVGRLKTLYTVARSMIRDMDPTDQLLFLRIRTSKHEMMLNSNEGEDYMAIVIQNPNEA